MAPRKLQRFAQPIAFTLDGVGDLANSGKAIPLGEISTDLQLRLQDEILRHLDLDEIAEAVQELSKAYGFRLRNQQIVLVAFRAIAVVMSLHHRRPVAHNELTAAVITFVPFSASELMLGLASIQANSSGLPYVPALTLLPQLLETRGCADPTLLRARKRAKPSLPSEEEVRASPPYQYALGWVARWLQMNQPAKTVSNSQVFDLGNDALMLFQLEYERAFNRRVDFDRVAGDVSVGKALVQAMDKVMLADFGREAAEPAFDPETLKHQLHPAVAAAQHCVTTLADEATLTKLRYLAEEAIRELSKRQLEAWGYRHLDKLNDEEMARNMGDISKHAARTHLERAETSVRKSEFVITLQGLADACEDPQAFVDIVSMVLGPEAYKAVKSTSPHGATNPAPSLEAINQRTQGGTKDD